MAITISTPLFLHSPVSPCSSPALHFRSRHVQRRYLLQSWTRRRPICFSLVEAGPNVRKEDIIIVGAGIAGLATALSLHRLGVRSLVLEQAESLRTSGTSLTLFKNGWSVLDAIGVAEELRNQFLEIQGMVVKSEDGRKLRSFNFKEEAEGQEVRAVERRILLETLAKQLPSDSICFSSKLAKIEKTATGQTLLELVDGTQLLAKIVIGCDGIRSPIAKWMGFSEPRYAGHCAFRGLGFYPNGQPFEPTVNYVYGRGLRAGFVPVSPTKVYWFICFNSSSPGPRITDPSILKKEAREMIKGWPTELLNVIDMSAEDTLSRTPLIDRWLWPIVSPSASAGGVVLAGDAWHPMTPNLGQGGCCALEDAIVLSRKLAGTLKSGRPSVDDALRSYSAERWPRIFPLTIRANLVGALLQWENPVVCDIRNSIVVPKLVRLRPLLEHTNFTFEPLSL
ncbi:hypothetical protein NE237_012869 [Protea cynaroides]|uniref:FAD-binding domain-containing protein n=1 Tax=Protea cynaroides TaxID=273540 RepID=A0A9Q0JY14_9MAGN|nr:hypothetical protein NE237_012869 [Protea cynaroides]